MEALLETLRSDPRLAAAIVFGSAARGTLRPDSDVDVAVLATDADARARLETDLLGTLGDFGRAARRDVHLVDLERADPALRRSVFGHGRVLFDHSDGRLRELEVATLIEYFDGEYLRRVIDEGAGGGWSRRSVDADVLRRKTEQVLHHCARLARRVEVTAADLAADEDLRNAVLMDLQQAIQACIDLAAHACVDEHLGGPATPAEAFALLARHGSIEETLCGRLTGAAGLRNLIVHQYSAIDLARIVQMIRTDLDDLRRFVAAFHGG